MRILLIAGEYPPLQGGLGDYTRELARALAALQNDVHVLTRATPSLKGLAIEEGVTVHRVIERWNWSSLSLLGRFIQTYRPDVLNLQYQAAAYHMHVAINMLPRWFARRIPVVVTFHDLLPPYLFPKAGALRQRVVLDMARRAATAIVTNVEDRDALRQANVLNATLIPIGSNITPVPLSPRFDREAWLRARSIPAGTRVVGYFGFMNESKGGETLIRALAELVEANVDVRLMLIGGQTGESDPTNVDYAHQVMQLAGELRLRDRIVLTGYMGDRDVSESLVVCDCLALPYRDGASFRRGTLMAALAHGCAVVTTEPRVSVPELAHEENVLLVPPSNAHQLAAGIRRVLDDAELRERLRAGSKQLSQLFTWDRIAADTVALFESLK